MGIVLPDFKQATRHQPICQLPAPPQVILALDQHHGLALTPCVQVGERVLAGQLIAIPEQPLGAHLHASIAGVVTAIELQPSGNGTSPCLIINSDHSHESFVHPPCVQWQTLDSLALCQHLALGGVAGLGGAVFPTGMKLSAHQQHDIDTLIINGMECEPYITCDDRLMQERAVDILRGTQILMQAAQAKQAFIAIEHNKPQALQAMQHALAASNDARMSVRQLPTHYPAGDEAQLITQLLQREVPRGQLPADIGVVVHNVGTAYAAARWVLAGEPLISRIVTITGALAQVGNVEVLIGTPITVLLNQLAALRNDQSSQQLNPQLDQQPNPHSPLLIMGGPMMGKAVALDAPITKGSNCLICAPHTWHTASTEQPCIRCGECMHACPVNLLPQQLLWHAQRQHVDALNELGLRDCIECGCCDYVCPSQIPLVSRFRLAKQAVP